MDDVTFNPSIGLTTITAEEKAETNETPEELALRVVSADIEVAKNANNAEKGKREECYELYRAMGDGKEDRPGRSRIKSSDVMDMIEWLMPSLVRAFLASKNAVSVAPIGTEDIHKAEMFQKLLNWQFNERANGFRVAHEWIKSSLIYGYSPVKITWHENYVRKGFALPEVLEPKFEEMRRDPNVETLTAEGITEVQRQTENPMAALMVQNGINPNAIGYEVQPYLLETVRVYENVRGEQRIKTYSGPLVEVVPPEDFFIDPEAKDIADARFVIHRVKRTVSYLKQKEKEGIYSNIDEVIDKQSSSTATYTEDDDTETAVRANDAQEYRYQTQTNDLQRARRKVNVWEWWGLLDPDDSGIAKPYLVVVANNVVIRMERNPYAHGEAPFEIMRPILDVFSAKGLGIVDLVGEYQKVKTAIMRQTLDNISFQNNQMWLVDENAGVDLRMLKNPRPGGVVRTNNMNGVRQIVPSQIEGTAYNVMEFIQGQLEQRTGITRYNQGLDASTLNKTATGISAIMNASSQRIELIARVMAETGFRKLYQKMLSLDQQFVDQNIVIRVFNKPIEISPDDLIGNFDVSVDVGGATNKDQSEMQQLMTLLNYSGTLIPLGVMSPSGVYEICKKILDLCGIAESEKYISNPNDAEKIKQVVAGIDQLIQGIQQGQLPDITTLAQAIIQARGVLASVVASKEVERANPQPGVAPQAQKDMEANSRAGNMQAYSQGVIAGGQGNR